MMWKGLKPETKTKLKQFLATNQNLDQYIYEVTASGQLLAL